MDKGVVVKILGDATDFEKQLGGLDKVAKVGLAALAAGVGAVSAAMVYSSTVGMEYETSLAKIGTIADESAASMGSISDDIKQLSTDTGLAANELAEACYEAISSGIDTAKAVEFTASATKLAKGGFTDTSSAVDVMTTILNAYSMSADEATKVSDILIQTQNKGKTTVAELSANMGKVIPTANAYSVKLEQLGASYAIMTANGIATAETTTYLNSMINELGKSGTTASDALKKTTGKTFKELMDSGMSLGEVLNILKTQADESGLSMGDMFGSAEAGKAAMTLLKDGVDGFNSSVTDMINSTGATETAFETMQNTTETALDKFKNNIKNTGITFYEKFKTPLKDGLQAANKGFDTLTRSLSSGKLGNSVDNLGKSVGNLIEKFVDFAKKALPKVIDGLAWFVDNLPTIIKYVGAAAAGFIAYKTAMTIATATQAIMNATMAANPIGLMITAVAGLTAGIVLLCASQEQETETEKKQREEYENTINTIKDRREEAQALIDSHEDVIQKTYEASAADIYQLERIQDLVEELPKLVDANGKVKEGCEARANYILGEYNKALSTEYDSIDALVTKNGSLKDEIYKVIEAKKAQIMLKTLEEGYTSAIEKRDSAERALAESSQKLSEAWQNSEKAQSEYADAYDKTTTRIKEIDKAIQDENNKFEARSYDVIKSLMDEKKAIEQNLSEKYSAAQQTSDIFVQTQQEYDENNENIKTYYADIADYQQAETLIAQGEYEKAIEIVNSRVAAFKTVDDIAAESKDKQREILEKQVSDTEELTYLINENYKKGVKGFNEERVKEAEKRAQQARDELEKFENEMKAAGEEIGKQFVNGISNGMSYNQWAAEQRAKGVANGIIKAEREAFYERSPSKKGEQIGAYFTQGIGIGIEEDKSGEEAARNTAQSILDQFKNLTIPSAALDMVRSATQWAPAFLQSLAPSSVFTAPAFAGGTTQNTYNSYTTQKEATIIDNVLTLDGEIIYRNQKSIADRKGIDISSGGNW